MRENKDLKLAVLIDADNIPYSNIKGMLDEIAKIGIPTIKRIYGDWTKPTVSGWKQPLLEHAITPIQQYSYTTGKNATDSAMIIDAMDILHSEKVDGFCLVSSDSDFTRLAVRLRESGMLVIGIGEKKTPNPFIVACDKFIYIEIIGNSEIENSDNQQDSSSPNHSKGEKDSNIEPINKKLIQLLKTTVMDLADDDGWAFLGDMGNLIIKKRPDFDPRNYGYPKLTPLIKSLNKVFDIDVRVADKKHIKHIYVKIKE
ncbi:MULTISPECIES: NYN domain-containing protein [unclassified Dysgonomonas]|uniref:NYN domain-containing protein n=1 Tax=unclassified Dysgonomonas TaxID=2630389 RepID=UPI00068354EF|nr:MULTISPECIES: NYN domain-containing protein [unclassified Dysgonomonas]MBD8346898.1 NYN domain-containing protein [Dysgonomonas sp. HGC4]MBF0575166.1 NYN domain-containing protein [Dysgonomonas sp. GY617]